jgi:predicted Ser/Thr protein kinase
MDEGRFPPGTLLAQRYRVVSLLGRGGMGEVYRVNDLLLGQTVALKFLPARLTSDESTRERFRNEVRTARQVSHPNVCRVYDIGDAEGSTWLSMEYVDGEDLASLLRRIGRLPPDKAMEIAGQLCAGLAAAHDKGVLHRDLKPRNIMLDGQGHLRITDFGLAGLAGDVKDIRSGTPGYMAPEQLSGREVTARSDIYALGVVLHEIFTGKRPSPDSTHPELAPEVDRVIRRCLAEDPAKRPASALQVAAALPGGDPLAAAVAAGETPSPEMVAAAGESEGLRPIVAWGLLAGVVAMVAAVILLSAQSMLYRRVPLDKPPEVLAESARNILQSVGYSEPPVDTARGFYEGTGFLRYVAEHDKSKTRWDHLETGAFVFWYRGSPRPLAARTTPLFSPAPIRGFVWTDDPPLDAPGMTLVSLNPLGRLTQLIAVPPLVETQGSPASSPDWGPLFAAAGLDLSKWPPAQPAWSPPVYGDVRAAWTGSLAERPDIPIRIEAAAWRGKPVYFELIGPWTEAERAQPDQAASQRTGGVVGIFLLISMLVGCAMLARRNLRLGRGDRRGASRLAYVMFAAVMVYYFVANHVQNFREFGILMESLVWGLASAGIFWVFYMALEPYVRRRWPATLVSWNRLLSGGFRDPLVGYHVLVGCLAGAFSSALMRFAWFVPSWLGGPPAQPLLSMLQSSHIPGLQSQFLGARPILAGMSNNLILSVGAAFFLLFFLCFFRALLRKDWAAAAAFVLFLSVASPAVSPDAATAFATSLILYSLTVVLIIRFGLLALAAWLAFQACLVENFPLTPHLSSWYAGISLAGILLMAAIACYSFYTSLGGRPIFGSNVLEE